jgi:hypothetical protein
MICWDFCRFFDESSVDLQRSEFDRWSHFGRLYSEFVSRFRLHDGRREAASEFPATPLTKLTARLRFLFRSILELIVIALVIWGVLHFFPNLANVF